MQAFEKTIANAPWMPIVRLGPRVVSSPFSSRVSVAYFRPPARVSAVPPVVGWKVGNHEFYAGTNLSRYLDQTWQKWGPIPSTQEQQWGDDPATQVLKTRDLD